MPAAMLAGSLPGKAMSVSLSNFAIEDRSSQSGQIQEEQLIYSN